MDTTTTTINPLELLEADHDAMRRARKRIDERDLGNDWLEEWAQAHEELTARFNGALFHEFDVVLELTVREAIGAVVGYTMANRFQIAADQLKDRFPWHGFGHFELGSWERDCRIGGKSAGAVFDKIVQRMRRAGEDRSSGICCGSYPTSDLLDDMRRYISAAGNIKRAIAEGKRVRFGAYWRPADFLCLGHLDCENHRSCFKHGGQYGHSPAAIATSGNSVVWFLRDDENNILCRAWGALYPTGAIATNFYAKSHSDTGLLKLAIAKVFGEQSDPNVTDHVGIYFNGDAIGHGDIERMVIESDSVEVGYSCSNCGDRVSQDNTVHHDGEDYCESCYNDLFTSCDECGEVCSVDDIQHIESSGNYVCDDCVSNNYVEDYNDELIHERDAVELYNGSYAHCDDDNLCRSIDGDYFIVD